VPEEFDDIILSELNDQELTEQMHEDLYDGLAEEIAEGTQILLDRGWEATKVLEEALLRVWSSWAKIFVMEFYSFQKFY